MDPAPISVDDPSWYATAEEVFTKTYEIWVPYFVRVSLANGLSIPQVGADVRPGLVGDMIEALNVVNIYPEIPSELIHRAMGPLALEAGDAHDALEAYMALNDKRGIRLAAEVAERNASGYCAVVGWRALGDEKAIERVVNSFGPGEFCQPYQIDQIAGTNLCERIEHEYGKFLKERALQNGGAGYAGVPRLLAAISKAVPEYDAGVALTRGGVFGGYLAQRMGLQVIFAQTKRKGKGATFEWLDDPAPLRGAKVLVFDDDVVKGRTLRRAAREITAAGAQGLDLLLVNECAKVLVSDLANVPASYGTIIASAPEKIDLYALIQECKRLF